MNQETFLAATLTRGIIILSVCMQLRVFQFRGGWPVKVQALILLTDV